MAAAVSVDVMMNLVFGAIAGDREARRQLDKLHADSTASGFKKGISDSTGALKSEWGPAVAKLSKAGMLSAGDVLVESYKESSRIQMSSTMQVIRLEKKIEQEKNQEQKKRLIAEKKAYQQKIKVQAAAQKNMVRQAEKEADKVMDLRKQQQERMDRSSGENMKVAGENVSGLIESAFSADNIDAKGLTEGIGKMLGKGLSMGAGKMSTVAGGGKAALAMSGMAAAVAGIAAPLAALVGVLAAATGNATAMNKALMEGASTADILGDSTENIKAMNVEYGALNFRLKMLRRVTLDTATDFNMSKEEVSGYITALNEAGITTSEFRGITRNATNDMQAYRDVTRTAIAASQGLGISASETGDFLNKMTRDMGADLTDVQGAFGMIFSEAKNAGMSTKNFFAAINEASSGMALYNFRVSDTVGLFTDLVEILGEDLAKQTIGLEGTFRNQGMQERVKTTMLMGTGNAKKIATADAMAQGKVFAKTLAEKGINIPELGDLTSAEGLKKLGGMDPKAFRDVYSKVTDPAAKRQLISMRELAKGMNGGLLNVAQSLGSLSKTGELAAQLSQGAALMGGKAISEASGKQQMMMQEALGISGEQWETLKRMDIGLRSEFEQMQAGAKEGDEILSTTFEEALAGGLLSQSKVLEEGAELRYSLMERSAMEQLQETRSMSQTLSNKIAGLLENIYIGLEHLVTMFSQSSLVSGIFGESTSGARSASIKTEGESAKAIQALGKDILSKRAALDVEKDPAKRAALREELKALEGQVQDAKLKMSEEKAFRTKLAGGAGVEEARTSAASDMFADQFGMSPEEYVAQSSIGSAGKFGSAAQRDARLTVTAPSGGNYMDSALEEGAVKDAILSGEMSPEEAAEKGFEVAIAPLEALTTDQIAEVAAQAKIDREQEEKLAAEQAKDQLKTTKAVKGVKDILSQEVLANIAAATGMDIKGVEAALREKDGKTDLLSVLKSRVGNEGGPTDEQARKLAAQLGVNYGKGVEDFIYRGDGNRGSITPINSADQFFGAKPGGPIDKAMGGGGKTVNISINGGDEGRVYNIVKRVLRDSGYGDVKRY